MADTIARKAVEFMEKNRERPFFLYFATHDVHVPRAPHSRFRGTSGCGVRGDVIQQFDWCVGEIMATLERLKLADNTLLIFSSDNGGVMDDGYEDEGGFDHPCNGKLRGRKSTLWEGGHRVPFIARWPGVIKAGAVCDDLVTQIDMFATLAELTGSKLPDDAALDSISVLPALLGRPGDTKQISRSFIAHIGGVNGPFAVREGPWKLVQGGGKRGAALQTSGTRGRTESLPSQLYNVAEDLSEVKDLASQKPQKARELEELLGRARSAGRTRPVAPGPAGP